MEKEKITIIITYDDANKFGSVKRKIDVYGVGDNENEELLFSETETATRSFGFKCLIILMRLKQNICIFAGYEF